MLLVESLLLCALGLVLGLALAHALAANRSAAGCRPRRRSRQAPGIRRRRSGRVVALALGAGILATLIPAWRAYRLDVAATLVAEG